MASWELDRITIRLREAAANTDDWPDLLADLSETIGGSGAILFSQDTRLMRAPASRNLQMDVDVYFKHGWHEKDTRYRGVPIMERNGFMTDLEIMAPEEIAVSDFYQDFLRPNKCDWFAGIGFRAGGDLWCLALQRSAAQGPYQRDEIERLKTLWRPFSDAATLSRVLDQTHIAATTDALEHVQYAAMVCDARGNILELNAEASRLIGPMVDVVNKTMNFRDANSSDRFHRMVASALKREQSFVNQALTAEVLDGQGRPLLIRAVSLEGKGRFVFSNASVLLLIKPRVQTRSMILAKTYRLTPTETRIVEALSSGISVQDIAANTGVKAETIRTQLKAIFSKTDTHRQSQLVALFSALPGEKS